MIKQRSPVGTDAYPVGKFKTVFTGEEPFLRDHVIQNQRILPGMAYLEMARAAVAASLARGKEMKITLADSYFVRPMVVKGECEIETWIYPGSSHEFGIEVRSSAGLHFQSKAYVEAQYAVPAPVDIAALESDCPRQGPSREEFYAGFKAKGIEIGPSLQGIQSIRLGENCSLVTAELAGTGKRGMVLDVGVLDSFIQSSDCVAGNGKKIGIPYAVMKTEIFGPLDDRMHGSIRKSEKGYDFSICDGQGRVKVLIKDFIGREMEAARDEVAFYEPFWQPHDASGDGGKKVTVIRGQSDYGALVKDVVSAARHMILDRAQDQVIEVDIPLNRPMWRGISGLLKTLSLESAGIEGRMSFDGGLTEVAFRKAALPEKGFDWADGKVILITGGMGGLGRTLARDIVKTAGDCTLLLLGRRELDAEGRTFLDGLRDRGNRAVYLACDILDEKRLETVLAPYPVINGIIHASGTLADSYIAKKTGEEIDRVLAPKVAGMEILDRLTAHMALDFFVAFSSIASALGNPGQADYAAANGYMDAFMHQRAAKVREGLRKGRSVSINWSLWQGEGMQVREEILQNFERVFKVRPMPAEAGLGALKRILAGDSHQVVAAFGNARALDGLFEKRKAPKAPETATADADSAAKLRPRLISALKAQVAEHQKYAIDRLDENADWAKAGFDSISLASLVNAINDRYETDLTPTVFFEATSILQFADYLLLKHPDKIKARLEDAPGRKAAKPEPAKAEAGRRGEGSSAPEANTQFRGMRKAYRGSSRYREQDIAVIGMSCRIAGARNPDQLWKMLDEERDMISEIPKARWDWRDYPGASKWGSFIDGVEEFDPLFFDISPMEAVYMAPEQRLMMQYVWECLENAGYAGDQLRGSNTGLFVGCGPTSYSFFLDALPVEAYTATGFVPSVGPNRISYMLDWHGPSNPIETACSSALVAVHRAVEAIHAGHCDQAIAGGVSLLLSPEGYVSFSKSGMLCEDGKCKTFSSKANGYVRGEGVGMLMLKPFFKALQDGDEIHAVIKGTAENHGGKTNSLTAPNPKAQAAVINAALERADIEFSKMGYIECHGTGTPLGDPVEINGLKMVATALPADAIGKMECRLGSIKSNIGHLEYGAGVVGLLKVILQMKHRKIARSLHCETINPYIQLEGTPFSIAQTASPWKAGPDGIRYGGVSSFGFGGVNAHVIVAEYVDQDQEKENGMPDTASSARHIFPISARSKEALAAHVGQFLAHLSALGMDQSAFHRVAFSLQVGRKNMEERVAFLARDLDELTGLMGRFLKAPQENVPGEYYTGNSRSNPRDMAGLLDRRLAGRTPKQAYAGEGIEALAELWAEGLSLDWQALHA